MTEASNVAGTGRAVPAVNGVPAVNRVPAISGPPAVAGAPAVKGPPAARAPRGPLFRMPGHARKGAMTLHVLTSVGWFGITVGVLCCLVVARSTSDPAAARALYLAIGNSPWLAVPAGLLGSATGAVLALSSRYGLLRHWWILGKIAITAAVVLADAVVTGALANDAIAGRLTPALLYAYAIGHVLLLLVATVLSVYKPRGRTPWN